MGGKLLGMEIVKVYCGLLILLYFSYFCWKNCFNIFSFDEGESLLVFFVFVCKDKVWEVEEERECL